MDMVREAVVKPGETIEGRYKIVKPLDEGGMGTVFLAEHVLIKRRVAIKILHAELASDVDVVERFMNEARAAGTLGHPNIVESTDMGFTRNDVPYIVFEFLEGTLLVDEIYRVKGMTVRRSLRIARQIASALEAAHNATIVHRDLKSENIFLTDKGEQHDVVKVLDFGISRFAELESESSRRGAIMGTPEFMAPEQITSPESVDRRCDIWALGIVLYEMLTARRPFPKRDDTEALLTSIVHDPVPPLDRPDAPVGLQEMIMEKLLAKDPARRYPTMKDVIGAIEAFTGVTPPSLDSQPAIMLPVDIPRSLTPLPDPSGVVGLQPPARPAPRPAPWLALAALVIGGAGAATMFLPKDAPPAAGPPPTAALQTDADKLAAVLDAAANSAHARADGVAGSPMLRAAIETDAATLKDMAGGDFIFTANKNESLEIFQIRDGGTPASMLRVPPEAAAIPPISGDATRIQNDGKEVVVVASAPITRRDGVIGGAAAISQVVDLSPVKQALQKDAIQATLVGLGSPIVLAGPEKAATGAPITVPVSTTRDFKMGKLMLSALVAAPATPTVAAEDKLRVPRFAAWGLAGLLLLFYVAGLLRGRK